MHFLYCKTPLPYHRLLRKFHDYANIQKERILSISPQDTAKFFRLQKGQPFSLSHHLQFINMWYIVIIVNDVLTIVGSAIKINLDNRVC